MKDARDSGYLKRNVKSAVDNVLRTGGLYALLYASTQHEFGPNDESSYFYTALYNTDLLCLAHSINRVYSYASTQQHIGDVYAFNIYTNKCMVPTRDLDKLAELIKQQAAEEIKLRNQQAVKKEEVFNRLDDLLLSDSERQVNIQDSLILAKKRLEETTSNTDALDEQKKVTFKENVIEKHIDSHITEHFEEKDHLLRISI